MEDNPEERWTFAMGLCGICSTEASNGAEPKDDSSGEYLHLNNPDPSVEHRFHPDHACCRIGRDRQLGCGARSSRQLRLNGAEPGMGVED